MNAKVHKYFEKLLSLDKKVMIYGYIHNNYVHML